MNEEWRMNNEHMNGLRSMNGANKNRIEKMSIYKWIRMPNCVWYS